MFGDVIDAGDANQQAVERKHPQRSDNLKLATMQRFSAGHNTNLMLPCRLADAALAGAQLGLL